MMNTEIFYISRNLAYINYGIKIANFNCTNAKPTTMVYFIIYLLIAISVSFFSLGKRVSFVEIFYISTFLTPIVGLITVFKAENNIRTHHYTMTYTCRSCENGVEENEKTCQDCGQEMEVLHIAKNKLKLANG